MERFFQARRIDPDGAIFRKGPARSNEGPHPSPTTPVSVNFYYCSDTLASESFEYCFQIHPCVLFYSGSTRIRYEPPCGLTA